MEIQKTKKHKKMKYTTKNKRQKDVNKTPIPQNNTNKLQYTR